MILIIVIIIIIIATMTITSTIYISMWNLHCAAQPEPGSAGGFCLLKGNFSLPLSPSAFAWWGM